MDSGVDSGLAPAVKRGAGRLDSIDALRGLVMIIMALDHIRGFFSEAAYSPTDLAQTNVPLFFTRWITHFCAPIFVFLSGTGAFLSTLRGKTVPQLSWFLFSRGLWLAFLEVTWVRCLGWNFNFDYTSTYVGVLWAIGWSMVALSALVFLPMRAVGLLGVLVIAGHNLLDPIKPEQLGGLHWLWVILHESGGFSLGGGRSLGVGYPVLPWLGVMAAGYGLGELFTQEPARRQRTMLMLGAGLILLFFVLRGGNLYGDPTPWTTQKNTLFTFLSWLHCQKYPPSLLYVCMTLGPGLIALALLDRGMPRWLQPSVVFGRVPLFYYLLHLPLIHAIAVAFSFARHGRAEWLYGSSGAARPADYGYGLPVVYLVWLAVVLALYPACRWFADLKKRRKDAWLSYL